MGISEVRVNCVKFEALGCEFGVQGDTEACSRK